MSRFNQVGKRQPRTDGLDKVTGRAVYGNDLQLPGMLYGACRYTDHPAARIRSIDTSEAMAVPGVVKIATFEDIPGNPLIGCVIKDYLPIVKDEVVFTGDVLAVVAAETREAAALAVDKIRIDYELIDPITDVEKSLEPDARRIHSSREDNVVARHHTQKGDVDQGFAKADEIIERAYRVGFVEHAYIEPECLIAWSDPLSGQLTISGSIQNAHKTRAAAASFLDIPQSELIVQRAVMGGSFGGKDDIIDHFACRVGLMAKLTNRPVKMTYTREESIRESSKRHPYLMKYKAGFTRDGRICALKVKILADSGAYSTMTPFVTWRSVVQAAGPYDIDNVRVDITGVYTNNNYTSAMRGFGSPQIIYANESLLDEIAGICQISPIEIRQKNCLRQGGVTITGQKFDRHTVSTEQVLMTAVQAAEYEAKVEHYRKLNAQGGPERYGIGLAVSYRGCSLGAEGTDASSALITINSDASINVSTSVSENGQGLKTSMAIIAAEILGVTSQQITVIEPPTSMIADGGGTVASRGTLMGGNAVKEAAEILRQRLFDVVKGELGIQSADECDWNEGVIRVRNQPERSVTFAQAVNICLREGVNLAAYGWYKAPDIHWDEEKGQGSPYFTWVYGCQIAEVKLNIHTGKLEVIHVTAAHDVGRVINRVGLEGQVSGGIAQGIGMAILEDYNITHGEIKSENFDTYLLPTIKDIPPITFIPVENPDPDGPFGAKSIGEPATETTAAAINNALAFASGRHHYQLPLTLEQIVLGYNLKKPERQSEIGLSGQGDKKQRLRLTDTEVVKVKSIEQALESLATGEYTLLAGGTDSLVQGRLQTGSKKFIDISGLEGLCDITRDGQRLRVGGGVTFTQLVRDSMVRESLPLLAQACITIGSKQIRNRATVAGNIVNAAPCADSIPPWIAYGAEVELRSLRGVRTMPLDEFVTGGYRTQREADEILTAVWVNLPEAGYWRHFYSQLGRRNALNITRQSLSVLVALDDQQNIEKLHLVDGALFSYSQRRRELENLLIGSRLEADVCEKAKAVFFDQLDSAIGKRWSAPYKVPVSVNMFEDLMAEIRQACWKTA